MLHPSVTLTAPVAMVSTVDHLATTAGLDLLAKGGSAADAAVGANAVLAVTSPHMCGMGGDAWALVHDGDDVHALDASGRAGSGADPDRVRAAGHHRIPLRGDIVAVTVPAAVDGWLALHERFGRLPLADVLAAAIGYAADGFPVAPLLARAAPLVAGVEGSELPAAPVTGEVVHRPGSARSLQAIVDRGRDGFYGGEFGGQLLERWSEEFRPDDLAESQARWVTPISAEAWGHRVWSPPPTSQGYLTVLGAAIADSFPLDREVEGTHVLIEAAGHAGHDRPVVLHDGADGDALVAAERIAAGCAALDLDRAGHVAVPAGAGDTTYLCVVDADRMGVSLINSNASGFGAHLVAGTTGIFLHDRGLGFTLEPGHPAEYGPGRRPPHTLSPALVTRPDGSLRSVLGTMGGDAQPQIVLQLLAAGLHDGLDPGRALGRPRWRFAPADGGDGFSTWQPGVGRVVELEDQVSAELADGLAARGHEISIVPAGFGHAHVIEVTAAGSLAAAADPRALTGMAAGR